MNISELTDFDSAYLAPHHQLRRATQSEIEVIREEILKVISSPTTSLIDPCWFWERTWQQSDGKYIELPPEKWRYFVIAFEGTNSGVDELKNTFNISEQEPEVAFTVTQFLNGGRGTFWNPNQVFHTQPAMVDNDFFRALSLSDVQEIATLHTDLQQHNHNVINLQWVITELGHLKELPRNSPLRFLGYFAVLERLLTHAPKETDPYDSITRQVKKKIALINNRLLKPLDYSPFGNTAQEIVWGKLYTYRSAIAHGSTPNFKTDLKILKSTEQTLDFLQHTVKAITCHALREPQLLADLHEC